MIITLASSKGGVGKSTTAACLAGALAKNGNRVHIVDLDNNKTVSRWLSDDATRPALISVSAPDPMLLTEHLQDIATRNSPDFIFIDVAGNYERALTVAIARAHLTIIPACTTEADIYEAARIAKHIQSVYAAFGKKPLYRLLLTKVQPLVSHAQAYAYKELERLKIPKFKALVLHRAAYEEIGLSGTPPHYGDLKRPTVAKAVDELNQLVLEILTLLNDVDSPDRSITPTTAGATA